MSGDARCPRNGSLTAPFTPTSAFILLARSGSASCSNRTRRECCSWHKALSEYGRLFHTRSHSMATQIQHLFEALLLVMTPFDAYHRFCPRNSDLVPMRPSNKPDWVNWVITSLIHRPCICGPPARGTYSRTIPHSSLQLQNI